VYDGNGDEIPTYTAGVGWHEKESKAERKYMGLCRQLTMMRSGRQGKRSMLTLLVWKYSKRLVILRMDKNKAAPCNRM